MRMFRTCVNTQVAELHTAQRTARDHALNRLLDDALRKATLEDRLRGALFNATDETGVVVVNLVLTLASR